MTQTVYAIFKDDQWSSYALQSIWSTEALAEEEADRLREVEVTRNGEDVFEIKPWLLNHRRGVRDRSIMWAYNVYCTRLKWGRLRWRRVAAEIALFIARQSCWRRYARIVGANR